MSVIRLEGLGFRYPNATGWVLQDLSLNVAAGEFVAIVGGSGVGKSTLLRMIAGLIAPQAGSISLAGVPDPARRRWAMVFQDGRLLPWRRVAHNVMLGLEGLALNADAARQRAHDALWLTGLADMAERWPHQLSGGQVQRVGIARALAVEPDILLMDEPFSAVDAMTRRHLQTELVRIWQSSGKAVIFVTHDIDEAVFLADRVIVLGGQPAGIVREEKIFANRIGRRDSVEFLNVSERLNAALGGRLFDDGGGI